MPPSARRRKTKPGLARLAALLATKAAISNGLPAGDFALALFKYRSGDPLGALELVRTDAGSAPNIPVLATRAGVLSALCLARIGRWNEAQAGLDSVGDLIDKKFNSPFIAEPADLGAWRDWWVDHILLQEARELIQQRPGSNSANE